MKAKVTWFRNNHEQRNEWIRFGFMRLYLAGEVTYRELPIAECIKAGFHQEVADHEHRHTSVLLIEKDGKKIKCLIESEDSFFWMSPLIEHVDVYFCSGYNTDFFIHKKFIRPFGWQKEEDIELYRKQSQHLIETLGQHFGKVRKIIPIAPSLGLKKRPDFLTLKWRNVKHKLHSLFSSQIYWKNEYLEFESRYNQLLSFRKQELKYDVVLLDSLWGWPKHRFRLHQKLKDLAGQFNIHSKLGWTDPADGFEAGFSGLTKSMFPVETQPVQDYELMLSQSRLGVFATGFHWGWRNIVMFALMAGLPVYLDRSLLEPYFDLNEFILFNSPEDGEFGDLEDQLTSISPERWSEIKSHNQKIFDTYMRPEIAARYLLNQLSEIH